MRLLQWLGASVVLAGSIGSLAVAQPATRGLTPVPFNQASPVSLSMTLDPKEARIGGTVSICFQSSREGYVTLWDISTEGQVARIFPNQFTKVDAAAPVQGQRRYCAGTGNDPFRFRVDGPPGIEDLYVLWTTRPELQPSGASYANAEALVADLQRLGAASPNEWGSQKLTYDVVPEQGPVAPVVPPPQVSGTTAPPPTIPTAPVPTSPAPNRPADQQTAANVPPAAATDAPKVYIFAMGANVGKLTKSNQDAEYFTKAVSAVFNVPEKNTRLVSNGTRADFGDGLQWLKSVATPRDYVFIYFSGHGGRFRSDSSDDGWDEFLVPYDFESANPDPKTLLFSQVVDILINRLPTKNVLTITDACHGGGIYRSMDASVLGARSKYYALSPDMIPAARDAAAADMPGDGPRTRAAGGRGRVKANGLLLAAASREQEALEGSKGSFFTLALVHELLSKDGGDIMEVFRRTVRSTEEMTGNRQEPVAVGDADLGRSIRIQ